MSRSHVPCGMLFPLTCFLLGGGCSNPGPDYPHAQLAGTVTVAGEPLPSGLIIFMPLESNRGGGVKATITDGHYLANDVPKGAVQVTFHAIKLTGRMVNSPSSSEPLPEQIDLIPDAYRDGLEIKVTEDRIDQDFQL